jgi:hypothetical protein
MRAVRGRHSKLSGSFSSCREGRHLSHRAARHHGRRTVGPARPFREALHLRSRDICWPSPRQSVLRAVTASSQVPWRPSWRRFWPRVGASRSRQPVRALLPRSDSAVLGSSRHGRHQSSRTRVLQRCPSRPGAAFQFTAPAVLGPAVRQRSVPFRNVAGRIRGPRESAMGAPPHGSRAGLRARSRAGHRRPHAGSRPIRSKRSNSQYHLYPAPSNPGMQRTRFARR